MHRLGAAAARRIDDRRDIQIALARRRRPDRPRFVGECDMQRVSVGLRINRDRGDPRAGARCGSPGRRFRRDWRSGPCRTSSHPEDAEAGRFAGETQNRRVEAGGDRQRQGEPRVDGIDDPVVPQPGARIIGMTLGLVLRADRRLEFLLFRRLQLLSRSRRTCASTEAACSPPITEMRAFGHIHKKRGP